MPNDGPFNIDVPTTARYGLGGLAAGAGVASALSLVHLLNKLNEERKAQELPPEGVLTLTLPRKTASDPSELGVNVPGVYQDNNSGVQTGDPEDYEEGIKGDTSNPISVKKTEGPSDDAFKAAEDQKGTEYEEGIKADDKITGDAPTEEGIEGDPSKEPLGRKPEKKTEEAQGVRDADSTKEANWPTLTASLLAAGGGGALGMALVNKIYQNKRIKDKERELEDAQQEYLDQLSKGAEAPFLDSLFTKEAVQAENRGTFSLLDYPAGLGVLFALLGAGGTGYLTKRVLDEHTKVNKPPSAKPEVSRIVFKSAADGETDQKCAESLEAMLGVYTDILRGEPRTLCETKCAAYLEDQGIEQADLYKQAVSDFDTLMTRIYNDDGLRKNIQRAYMDSNPLAKYFKWGLSIPGLSHIADRKMYEKLQTAFQPSGGSLLGQAVPPQYKQAGLLFPAVADVAASYYGSTLAEKDDLEEEEAAQVDTAAEEPDERTARILDQLEISADDPAAAEFIQKNKAAIVQAIQNAASQGGL
jgi:hypothetical protein